MSLLKVTNLGKSFGGVKAVDGISFELSAGELLALIGPNGAGKTTTFNMVNGQLKADVGSITLDGQELLGMAPRDIWRMGVSRTFQIAETFLRTCKWLCCQGTKNFFRFLHGLPTTNVTKPSRCWIKSA